MAAVISIASQKGGVGKTTTALSLSAILGSKNKKVLLIDMDSQANLTYSSGIDKPNKTITDVLSDECSSSEAVVKCKYYDLLCADRYLSNVEMSSDVEPTLLKKSIQPSISKSYDYIIIDTPPSLGNLSYCSLVASDYVVVPVEASVFSMKGLVDLHNTFQNIIDHHNRSLKILGILLIKYNKRTILSRNIKSSICSYAKVINTSVFNTTIRQGIAVKEAQFNQQPLIDYASKSKPTVDYISFTDEVLERIENNG